MPANFDPKQARKQVSGAVKRRNKKQRVQALPASQQATIKEAKRAYMRDYMAKRREKEDAERAANGQPPIKRKGAYGPRRPKLKVLPSLIPPEELDNPSENF